MSSSACRAVRSVSFVWIVFYYNMLRVSIRACAPEDVDVSTARRSANLTRLRRCAACAITDGMRTLPLLLLLPACASVNVERPVSLTMYNGTENFLRMRASIRDVRTSEMLFDRTARLLAKGAEEHKNVVSVEHETKLEFCVTILDRPKDSRLHYCRAYRTTAYPLECFASACPQRGAGPYASVACWDARGGAYKASRERCE